MAKRSESARYESSQIHIIDRERCSEAGQNNARATWADVGKFVVVMGIIVLAGCLLIMWAVGGE